MEGGGARRKDPERMLLRDLVTPRRRQKEGPARREEPSESPRGGAGGHVTGGRGDTAERRKQAGGGWVWFERPPLCPPPRSFLPFACLATPEGLSVGGHRAAILFPKEPLGPAWVKGLLGSLGVAAHLGRGGKLGARAALLPGLNICRNPPTGLRGTALASAFR